MLPLLESVFISLVPGYYYQVGWVVDLAVVAEIVVAAAVVVGGASSCAAWSCSTLGVFASSFQEDKAVPFSAEAVLVEGRLVR